MKKLYFKYLILLGVVLLSVTACKEDKDTINSFIVGNWQVDWKQTVYNGGLMAKYVGINTDSVGQLVVPTFDSCQVVYTADNAGVINFPKLKLKVTDTYEVNSGEVKMTIPSLASNQVKLNISTITATQMVATMSISDFTFLANAAQNANATNIDLMATLVSLVPSLSKLETQLSKVNFSLLGLNPTPTVTLVFNKK